MQVWIVIQAYPLTWKASKIRIYECVKSIFAGSNFFCLYALGRAWQYPGRPPCIPLLYSKTGVTGAYTFYLIFALKQRFWELVRTTSKRLFLGSSNVYPQSIFLTKLEKWTENCIFATLKIRSILHGHVCVMNTNCMITEQNRERETKSILQCHNWWNMI